MNKRKLKHFEGLLTNKIEALIGKAGQSVRGMSGEENTAFPDPTDRASLESDRNFVLRIRDRERKLILKAREALTRIKNGSYGYCDYCGNPIKATRLEARPEATLCIECKTEMEQRERQSKLG